MVAFELPFSTNSILYAICGGVLVRRLNKFLNHELIELYKLGRGFAWRAFFVAVITVASTSPAANGACRFCLTVIAGRLIGALRVRLSFLNDLRADEDVFGAELLSVVGIVLARAASSAVLCSILDLSPRLKKQILYLKWLPSRSGFW